jgi:sortase A
MFRSLKVSVLLICLTALVLGALPVVPRAQTASVELHPAQVETDRTLLGENGAELEDPAGAATPTAGGGEATMTLTVPRLDIEDVPVPTGSTQEELDREGIIRLESSGVPWQEGSNTFIVGHALGFLRTRVPYVFYDLDKMRPGDEILVEDSIGETYTFRVYDYMTVRPEDFWVTYPVEGKTTISLQSCTPIPSFENRLVVRGELVS